jgi:hypothetical protein
VQGLERRLEIAVRALKSVVTCRQEFGDAGGLKSKGSDPDSVPDQLQEMKLASGLGPGSKEGLGDRARCSRAGR